MTRRTALLALAAALAGTRTAAQPTPPGTHAIPTRHYIDLNGIAGFELTYKGAHVSLSMDDVWAALQADTRTPRRRV